VASNRVIRAWAEGRQALAAWMSSSSHLAAQILSATGVDTVVIDMQHGSASAFDLPGLIAAIELRGAEPFVRIPALDAGLVGRALDAGATGIIAPLVETPGQARALVEAALYPPRGRRSFGPRVPALRYGADYARIAHEEIVLLAMIETDRGLEALDGIAATEGLTGLFVGPSDLAISLGRLPPFATARDEVEMAISAIRSRGQAAGARVGLFCSSAEAGEAALEQGFDLVTIPADLAAIQQIAAAAIEQLRPRLARRLSGSRTGRASARRRDDPSARHRGRGTDAR
jgi:4-hydroxy-2-oxoheptanedioate aldolase